MLQGTIKWFDLKKGFGFIEQETGADIFVHHSGVEEEEPLQEGQGVSYEIEEKPKGPCAVNVRIL